MTEIAEVKDPETEEQESETTVEKPGEEEKKFTQKDVDRFILREKAKTKLIKEQLEHLQGARDETLEKYEKVISQMVIDMTKDVDKSLIKLLEKLDPLERLEYLSDPANETVFAKKQFPLTPKRKQVPEKEFKGTPLDGSFV